MFDRIRNKLTDTVFMMHFHATMTGVWFVLIFPSVMWWSESVPWLVILSVWANFASHWAAYAATRADMKQEENNGST